MSKKLLAVLLALVMTMALLPVSGFAANETCTCGCTFASCSECDEAVNTNSSTCPCKKDTESVTGHTCGSAGCSFTTCSGSTNNECVDHGKVVDAPHTHAYACGCTNTDCDNAAHTASKACANTVPTKGDKCNTCEPAVVTPTPEPTPEPEPETVTVTENATVQVRCYCYHTENEETHATVHSTATSEGATRCTTNVDVTVSVTYTYEKDNASDKTAKLDAAKTAAAAAYAGPAVYCSSCTTALQAANQVCKEAADCTAPTHTNLCAAGCKGNKNCTNDPSTHSAHKANCPEDAANCTGTKATCKADSSKPALHTAGCVYACTGNYNTCPNSSSNATLHKTGCKYACTGVADTCPNAPAGDHKDDCPNSYATCTHSDACTAAVHRVVYQVNGEGTKYATLTAARNAASEGDAIIALYCPKAGAGVAEVVVPEDAEDPADTTEPGTEEPTEIEKAEDFTDVTADAWYAEDLTSAIESGIVIGTAGGAFEPDRKMDVKQMAVMLGRLAGEELNTTGDGNTWFVESVEWATEAGLLEDVEDGELSRQDMILILWRLAEKPESDYELDFEDIEGLEGDRLTSMKWAVENGIVKGDAEGKTVRPGDTIKRSEIVTVMVRFDAVVNK